MIDTSKLLSKRTSSKTLLSREGVTNLIIIKKNVVKIDGLLKEKLVLSKVREGLLKQQRETERRREREKQLETERGDDDGTDIDPKNKKKPKSTFGGILKFILGGFFKFIGRLMFGILPKMSILLRTITGFTKFFGTILRGGLNFARVLIRVGAPIAKVLIKFTGSIFTQIATLITNTIAPAAAGFVAKIAGVLSAPFTGALARNRISRATRPAARPTEDLSDVGAIRSSKNVSQLTEKELKQEIKLRKKIQKERFLLSETDVEQIEKGKKITKRQVRIEKKQLVMAGKKEAAESLGSSAGDPKFFKRLGIDPKLGVRGADPKEIKASQELLESLGVGKARKIPKFIADKNFLVDNEAVEKLLKTNLPDPDVESLIAKASADKGMGKIVGQDALLDRINAAPPPKIVGKKGLAKFLGNIGGAQFLKPIRKFLNNTVKQIPFLGDLIGLLLDIFVFGEPVGRAAFMAIGGILGGFLGGAVGSLVPGPGTIIGGIIGGIGGDIIGGLTYDLIFGRKPAVNEAGTVTKGVVKGVSKGVQKFEEGGLVREYEPLSQIPFDKSTNLRSLAYYEKTQVGREVMVPIPIPMPSPKNQSEGSTIVVNQTSVKRNPFSQHYRRG